MKPSSTRRSTCFSPSGIRIGPALVVPLVKAVRDRIERRSARARICSRSGSHALLRERLLRRPAQHPEQQRAVERPVEDRRRPGALLRMSTPCCLTHAHASTSSHSRRSMISCKQIAAGARLVVVPQTGLRPGGRELEAALACPSAARRWIRDRGHPAAHGRADRPRPRSRQACAWPVTPGPASPSSREARSDARR